MSYFDSVRLPVIPSDLTEEDQRKLAPVYIAIDAIITQLTPTVNAPDDSAAATAGVQIGQFYHTNGTVKVRLT